MGATNSGHNSVVYRLRFGFSPVGSGGTSPPTGTDFCHEHHVLQGVPVHRKRFGFAPVGTSGGGPPPAQGNDWIDFRRRARRR